MAAVQLGPELAERGITASRFPQSDARMIPASPGSTMRSSASAWSCPTIPSYSSRGQRGRPPQAARVADRAPDAARTSTRSSRWRWPSIGSRIGPSRRGCSDGSSRPCLTCGLLISSGSRCPACRVRRPRGRRWQTLRGSCSPDTAALCALLRATRHRYRSPDPDRRTVVDDSLANLRPSCARCNRGRR